MKSVLMSYTRTIQICTDGLVGNLRLWSVQELVSRLIFISSKAYTLKQ